MNTQLKGAIERLDIPPTSTSTSKIDPSTLNLNHRCPGKIWSPSSSSDKQTRVQSQRFFFSRQTLHSLQSERIKPNHAWTPSKTRRTNKSRKNNTKDYMQTSGQTHLFKNCALGRCFFCFFLPYRIKQTPIWKKCHASLGCFIDLLNFDVLIYLPLKPSPKPNLQIGHTPKKDIFSGKLTWQ